MGLERSGRRKREGMVGGGLLLCYERCYCYYDTCVVKGKGKELEVLNSGGKKRFFLDTYLLVCIHFGFD